MTPNIVILSGLGDSGEKHWQSYWLKQFTNATKLMQDNWEAPQLNNWLRNLEAKIASLQHPTILVAHSLAVSLVLHWAKNNKNPNIIGAFLVAPADVDSSDHTPDAIRNFSPMPLIKLPFPSIVIASENDPYASLERKHYFAQNWGSEFINIGQKGHINSESDLEYWEEGQAILAAFISKNNL